jgi:peptidoglycan hydrolase CwlO-like protein
MNKYAEIYSEYGLKKMIQENLKEIQQKINDIYEVQAGRKWNPLCKDENIKILQEDIQRLGKDIKDFEEALLIQ